MNTQTQEALKMAIEALDKEPQSMEDFEAKEKAINACKEALKRPAQSDVDLELKQFSKNLIDSQIQDEHPLSSEQLWGLYETEQPAQEPVAWQWLKSGHMRKKIPKTATPEHWRPLYTHPHQWQRLTDDEIKELSHNNKCWMNAGGNLMFDWEYFGRAIEQALKEKNGY